MNVKNVEISLIGRNIHKMRIEDKARAGFKGVVFLCFNVLAMWFFLIGIVKKSTIPMTISIIILFIGLLITYNIKNGNTYFYVKGDEENEDKK